MNHKIKLVFIGTPDFAVPSFLSLRQNKNFEIVTVITQPDKPIGRKQVINEPAVKQEANKFNIPVYQPEKVAILEEQLKKIKPDVIVVIAYAQILPKTILTIPKYGCLNVHGSLLPKYRGAAAVQWPIINGDKETGITIIKMDQGLDTGQIISQELIKIDRKETGGSLFKKLSFLSAQILPNIIINYCSGKITPHPQDDLQANKVGKLTQDDAGINWQEEAFKIDCLIRAMNPWPEAWTIWGKKKIKIIEAKILPYPLLKITKKSLPGKIFIYNNELTVLCGNNAITVKKLQLESKKVLAANEFLLGYPNIIGDYFSSVNTKHTL